MYQKLVIGEADVHVRVLNVCVQAKDNRRLADNSEMWHHTFGYKKGDGIGCERRRVKE